MRSSLSSNPPNRYAIHLALLMFLFAMLAAMLLSHTAKGGDAPKRTPQDRPATTASKDVIPGIVVVKFRRSNPVTDGPLRQGADPLASAIARSGVTSLARSFPMRVPLNDADVAAGKVDLSRIHFAEIPISLDPVEVAAELAALPEVEYAEPKYYSYLCDVPNDSDYTVWQQRYFDLMHVAEGWALQKGSPNVVIATVDGGTNWQHGDLIANLWINPAEDINHNGRFDPGPPPEGDEDGIDQDGNGKVDDVIGWNFTYNSNNPRGSQSTPGSADHGTETASVFGAVTNNGRGMAGTSWNCRIMPVCAADPNVDLSIPYGFEGIEYASRMGARVINCSWYRAGGWANYSQMEQEVITAATDGGALVVAAAGNDHLQRRDDHPFYPASYEHALSVGATNSSSGEITYFTDIGLNVSVFAPGVAIRVAKDNGSYGTDQGTSHSSPLVAGLAGLLFAAHPGWTPDQVAEQIRITADPIDAANPDHAGSLGHGRVNFFRALSEGHSGIVVVGQGHFQTPSGRTFFLEGDTVILSVKVKNVLPLAAENLSFKVTVDPVLVPLAPAPGSTRLDTGAEDSLDFYFRVGNVASKRDVNIRLSWSTNANESDAHMFDTTVYTGGGFWERQRNPSTIPLWQVHAVSDRVAWAAGTTWGTSVVLRTVDGGEKWVLAMGNFPSDRAAVVYALDSLHAWIGDGRGSICATTDGGVSWRTQLYPTPQSAFIDGFCFSDPMHGCAVGDPGSVPGRFVVLQTSDGGTTWTHIPNEPVGATDEFLGTLNGFTWSDPEHIWFASWFEGMSRSRVWHSSDGGRTWSSLGERSGLVNGLAMRDDSVGIMCSGNVKNSEPAFFGLTTNGGTTWQSLPNALPEKGTMAAYPAGSTKAWFAGQSTVAYSSDNGATWVEQPTEHVGSVFNAISLSDPEHGWIITQWGEILWYRSLEPSTGVTQRQEANLPSQKVLEQNYPNPFNPKTVIKYTVGGNRDWGLGVSDVSLTVHDVLGREVAVLVHEKKQPGTYQVTFDASGLASGVYFCRMQAGTFVDTKKLLLIR